MEGSVSGEETTTTPPEETPPATTEEAVAEIAESPWSKELKDKFTDPEQQKAVDEFMRETYQPYVTKLEQQTKPNRDAERLWKAFHEDPMGTFQQVGEEILESDPDTLERVQAALNGTPFQVDPDDADDDDSDDDKSFDMDALPPEVREFVQEGIDAKHQREYENILKQVEENITSEDKDINPNGPVPFNRRLFEREIMAAEGNVELAMASYRESVEDAQKTFGLNVGDLSQLGNPPEEEEAAPPAIGSTTQAGGVTPPQEPDYKGDVGKAIDDMFSETPPPSVPS